jgi:hypothetical protein
MHRAIDITSEATVFAYRADGVLAALDRSPHSCRQRDIVSPGDFPF